MLQINWAMNDKQEFIDIVEVVYRGARKGRGLVVSPKGEPLFLWAFEEDLDSAHHFPAAALAIHGSWDAPCCPMHMHCPHQYVMAVILERQVFEGKLACRLFHKVQVLRTLHPPCMFMPAKPDGRG